MFLQFKKKISFRNRAFTLIELLAVIVILAIIAIIAVPIILNIIEGVNRQAVLRGAEGVVRAGNFYYMSSQSETESFDTISFNCDKDKCISLKTDDKGNPINLYMDGNAGIGTVTIDMEGNISFKLEKSGYCTYKYASNDKINIIKGTCDNIGVVDTTITKTKSITSQLIISAKNYIEKFKLQNNSEFPESDVDFTCSNEGCILQTDLGISYNIEDLQKLDFEETNIESGTVNISKQGEQITIYGLIINNFVCNSKDEFISCIEKANIGATKENPPEKQHKGVAAIVYLDPTDLTHKCTSKDVNSDTGTKNGCMKWYAYYEDNIKNTYTMILDHNTTAIVEWNSDNNNQDSSQIMAKLGNDTQDWNNILSPRLISADEIAKITNNENFDSKNKETHFFVQDLTQDQTASNECAASQNCIYAWLYDRTHHICTHNGCLNNATGSTTGSSFSGYWTSTPVEGNMIDVWLVDCFGQLSSIGSITSIAYGVRPVITISKSLINN